MSGVLVVGNATLDLVQRVERLPGPGETLLGAPATRCAGGKGFNQALAAARAGARVDFLAAIGRDGERLHAVRWVVADVPTDLSVIWVDAAGRNMIVSSAACAAALEPATVAAAAARLEPGDWLLLQGNLTAAATLAGAEAARARGAAVAVNAAPIAFDHSRVLARCDLLVVNEVEATTLAPGRGPREAAMQLARDAVVVLTLGADGACLIERGRSRDFAAPEVAAIDTAGAGDVLTGTLVALASQGVALARALPVAVAAASLAVTRPGTSTGFPTRAEIADLRAALGV